jgi:hypothetical protein
MTWKIDIYNVTGQNLVASDVPFVRATIRWRLDDPGSAEIDIRDEDLGDWPGATPWRPMRRRVLVRRNNNAKWAGVLLGLEQRIEGGVPRYTARCLGLRAWLERRVIHGDLSKANKLGPTIAWELIQHAQAQTQGEMGLTLGSVFGTGPLRTRHYCDGDVISEAISELANRASGGFDWEIGPDGAFNAWVGGRGSSVGTRVSPMDCERDGGWELSWDGAEADTYATALGPADEPCGPPLVTSSSSVLPPAAYGRWESVVESESRSVDELTEVADEHLQAAGRSALRLRVTRPGDFRDVYSEPWPGFGLGDRPTVILSPKNLIENPSFEDPSPIGQAQSGATITRVTSPTRRGSYALQVSTVGNGSQTQGWRVAQVPGPREGERWTFSAYVYSTVPGTPVRLRIRSLDVSGNNLAMAEASYIADDSWTRMSVTHTMPPGTATVNCAIYADGNLNTARTWVIDDVQLEFGGQVTDWVPFERAFGPVRPTMRVIGYSLTLEPPSLEFVEAELEAV